MIIFLIFLEMLERVTPQISQVFNSPEQVTAKLIQSCYDEQLQQYIHFKACWIQFLKHQFKTSL